MDIKDLYAPTAKALSEAKGIAEVKRIEAIDAGDRLAEAAAYRESQFAARQLEQLEQHIHNVSR